MSTIQTLHPQEKPKRTSRRAERSHSQIHDVSNFASRPVWASKFEDISGQALEKYLAGYRGAANLFTDEQAQFLSNLGTTTQEIYDFIEDWCEYGEPSFETALRVTEVRAEYFLEEQQGQSSTKIITPDFLPSKSAELGGFVWLPRIIAKARAKLRGEMSNEIMYGCGGDRAFLKEVGIDPAQFLRVVWNAGNDVGRIVQYVKTSAEFQETALPYHLKLLRKVL